MFSFFNLRNVLPFLIISMHVTFSQIELDNLNFSLKKFTIKENQTLIGKINDYYLDSKGNIYLIQDNSLHKFDNSGNEIKSITKDGNGPGEFGTLEKIILDSKDNIYLSDMRNNRIIKYNSNLEYVSEFKKGPVAGISEWGIINDSLLYTFSFIEPDNMISIYDLQTGKYLRSFGKNSKLLTKYHVNIWGGGILYCDEYIYYMPVCEYKLFKSDLLGNRIKINKNIPTHFRTVSSLRKSNDPFIQEFSTILNIYNINGYFYVFFSPPILQHKLELPRYDIWDKNGNLIKENLKTDFLHQSKQINNNTFIRITDYRDRFEPEDKRSIIEAVIWKLRNE